MKVIVAKDNERREFEISEEIKTSDFLKKEGVFFALPCGGNGKCLNCRVRIHGDISEITDTERKVFTDRELSEGMRLACYTKILGDAEIIIDENKEKIMTDFSWSGAAAEGEECFGVAFDIGTTTVCGYLFKLPEGKILNKRAEKNRQTTWGGDVISRIEASLAGMGDKLMKAVSDQINQMIYEMISEEKIDAGQVKRAVITGNTAMLYLLTGMKTDSIARAPFVSETLFGDNYKGKLRIDLLENCESLILPKCIDSYVGADITCAIVANDIDKAKDTVLMIDIGTNGEIVLANRGRMLCCSTAAGPAFEGSDLSCGVTAREGAVSRVKNENGTITFETIGQKPPVGFCGSGIVDALAVMAELGVMDETGRIQGDCFSLCGLTVSQKDVRNIQMGKAAICAGIKTLMKKENLSEDRIDRVIIAGGFGSYIDVSSAEKIGLIPEGFAKKAKAVGNSAAKGASEILVSGDKEARAAKAAEKCISVDLTTDEDFADLYIECMMFEQ